MAIVQHAPSYYLAPHVHCCRIEECVYILDLRNGKYLGVGGEEGQLGGVVANWPTSPADRKTVTPEMVAVMESLAQRGVLTTTAALSSNVAATVTCAKSVPFEGDSSLVLGFRGTQVFRLACSYGSAVLALRYLSLERIVEKINAARKHAHGQLLPATVDSESLIRVFRRYRALFYTAKDHCLLDSLVLLNFLARYGVFPTWVLGIQARPFSAHSWIQQGDCVLNDTLENVQSFKPIFAL